VIDFDPVPILQNVFVPSLWIYGGRDQSVPAMESVAILERLKAHGKDLTIRVFPTADHTLFVKSKEGEPFRWPGFAPGYLDAMTDWVLRRVNPPTKKRIQSRRKLRFKFLSELC
jgi:dienelactone hydrolase